MDNAKKTENTRIPCIASEDAWYRLLVENAHVGICVCQGNRICYANSSFAAMTGYTIEELTSLSLLRIVHEEDHPLVLGEYVRRMTGLNDASCYEFRGVTKDGQVKWLLMSSIRIDWDGMPAALDFVTDLTDRRQTEECLRESEARCRSLTDDVLDSSDVGLAILGRSHGIAWANRTFGEFFGIRRDFVMGKNVDAVFDRLKDSLEPSPSFPESVSGALKKSGSAVSFGFRISGPCGRYVECRAQPVAEGHFRGGWILHFYDVTLQKTAQLENERIQSRLLQSQRLETAGTLACGIAHDFNNLLQSISLNAHLLSEQEFPGESGRLYLSRINTAAERGAKLVSQLLTFSTGIRTQRKAISLTGTVQRAVEMLGWILPPEIRLSTELSPEDCSITADEGQIEQVLLNLAMNSRDAMPEGGALRISVSPVSVPGGMEVPEGDYVLLTVEDTGHGMSDETLARIYDPFFTTKEVGKGTGIGMSVVYGIVRESGGHIFCNSAPGEGASFLIYFDRVERRHPAKTAPEETKPHHGGRQRIMIVDDEVFIAEGLCDVLKAHGYEAVSAASGEGALRLYDETGGGLDLVVLDLGMPGMGGKECLARLMEKNPSLRVIVASGYDASTHEKEVRELGARDYISKPYSIASLMRMIETVLEG